MDSALQVLLSGHEMYTQDKSPMSLADALARIEKMMDDLRQNMPFMSDEREVQLARAQLAPF